MRRTSEEHSAVIRGQTVYVPWLDPEVIETRAKRLLERCGINCSMESIPVPVDMILEEHLGFHLEFDELGEHVLGSTLWATRTVRVDEKLDPSVHPEQLGEFRFTLGHEVGHIQLHQGHLKGLAAESDEPDWHGYMGENSLNSQADLFATYLLMPSLAIREAYRAAQVGSVQPKYREIVGSLARCNGPQNLDSKKPFS